MGMLDPAQGQSNFSLLGMLLGGRGYASNWLGQRDQINQQAAERSRIGAAAQGLLQSPEYKATNPDAQTQAQMALWAKMQPDFSGMGNNLLSQQIGAMYQSQSQERGAQLQKQATIFDDELTRQRMGITYDDQLKMDQVKRDRDKQDAGNLLKQRMDMPGSIGLQNFLKDTTGYTPPADYYVKSLDQQSGAPQLGLIHGSPSWNKAIDEIQPLKDTGESMKLLSDMANGTATFDQGLWNATRNNMIMTMKSAEKLGSYDEGLKSFLDQAVPDKGRFTTDWFSTQKTQLEMYSKLYAARATGAAGKWGIPVDDIPSTLKISGLQPKGPPPTEAPPGYGNDNKPAANAVAPERWNRPKPQAEKPGTGLLDTPGGQPARTRAWR